MGSPTTPLDLNDKGRGQDHLDPEGSCLAKDLSLFIHACMLLLNTNRNLYMDSPTTPLALTLGGSER